MIRKYLPRFIWPIVLVFIFGIYLLRPSLNLALFGDDWLTLHRYQFELGPNPVNNWTHLSYFFTSYGPQDIVMGLLQKVVGFNSYYYYLTSFLLRFTSTLSFIPIIFHITKSRASTLFGMLFFISTAIGLESTVWVFNMPTYISIIFLNLFLYYYIKSHEIHKFKFILISTLFYFLAYVSQSIRMTGLLPFVITMEIYFLIANGVTKNSLIYFLKRISIFLCILIYIFVSGNVMSNNSLWSERFNQGFLSITNSISQGQSSILLYPLITFGSFLLPDFIAPLISFSRRIGLILNLQLPVLLIFILVMSLILKSSKKKVIKKIYFSIFGLFGLWVIISTHIWYLNKINMTPIFTLLMVIGGYFLIILGTLFFINKRNHKIQAGIFLSIAWTFCSFLLPWFWNPINVIMTTHRYLAVSAVGVTILLSLIISLGKANKNKLFLFILFFPLILIQAKATHLYLRAQEKRHSIVLDTKIWSQIPYIPELGKDNTPLIFFFEGDSTNNGILFDVLTFGFPAKLEFKQGVSNYKNAITMDVYSELESAVFDGKSLKRFGLEQKPVGLDRIYAFKLIGEETLINDTEIVRNNLK